MSETVYIDVYRSCKEEVAIPYCNEVLAWRGFCLQILEPLDPSLNTSGPSVLDSETSRVRSEEHCLQQSKPALEQLRKELWMPTLQALVCRTSIH